MEKLNHQINHEAMDCSKDAPHSFADVVIASSNRPSENESRSYLLNEDDDDRQQIAPDLSIN